MGPADRRLFCSTVTIYHRQGEEIIRYRVDDAFYRAEKRSQIGAMGIRQEQRFYMVLPGGPWLLEPGDRVMEGVGPQAGALCWEVFVPALIPGLGEIGFVRPCHLSGSTYTECGSGDGGKWL